MNDSAATAPDHTSISTHLGWSTPKTNTDPFWCAGKRRAGGHEGKGDESDEMRKKLHESVHTVARWQRSKVIRKGHTPNQKKNKTIHQKLVPKSRPDFGPRLGSAVTMWQKKPGPKNGTHSGPSEIHFLFASREVLDDI